MQDLHCVADFISCMRRFPQVSHETGVMYYIQYLLLNHDMKYLPPNQQTMNFVSKSIQCGGHKGGAEGINIVPISEDGPRFCPTVVFTSRHSQPGHAKKSGITWS